jgi:hypothetical protein
MPKSVKLFVLSLPLLQPCPRVPSVLCISEPREPVGGREPLFEPVFPHRSCVPVRPSSALPAVRPGVRLVVVDPRGSRAREGPRPRP